MSLIALINMHRPWEGKHCFVSESECEDGVEGFLRIKWKVKVRECRRRSRLLSPCDVFRRCPQWNSCFSLRWSFCSSGRDKFIYANPDKLSPRATSVKSMLCASGEIIKAKITNSEAPLHFWLGRLSLFAPSFVSCASPVWPLGASQPTPCQQIRAQTFMFAAWWKMADGHIEKKKRMYIFYQPSPFLCLLRPISSCCCQSWNIMAHWRCWFCLGVVGEGEISVHFWSVWWCTILIYWLFPIFNINVSYDQRSILQMLVFWKNNGKELWRLSTRDV